MSRWFRHYVGMMRDPKFTGIAVRCKQPLERVLFVWGCILEDAAERQRGGVFHLDADEVAYLLRCDAQDVVAILAGLEGAQLVVDGAVPSWAERQFESDRDPTNADRQKRYRERRNGRVTDERNGHNAPHRTETETEKMVVDDAREARPAATPAPPPAYQPMLAALLEAGGAALSPASAALMSLSDVLGWIEQGADFDQDILPAIRAACVRAPPGRISSWAYFRQPVADARERRTRDLPTIATKLYRAPRNDLSSAFDRLDDRIAASRAGFRGENRDDHPGPELRASAG